jgi:hypothetical protein
MPLRYDEAAKYICTTDVDVLRTRCILKNLLNDSSDLVEFNPYLGTASHSLPSVFDPSASIDIKGPRADGRFSKHWDDDTVSLYLT